MTEVEGLKVTAGTQKIEGTWGVLKNGIPAYTHLDDLLSHCRVQQYYYHRHSVDRFAALGYAFQDYRANGPVSEYSRISKDPAPVNGAPQRAATSAAVAGGAFLFQGGDSWRCR